MISFRIGTETIELSKDSNISFTYENSAFLQDQLKLSRSQSFTIPRTPKNDAIFDYATHPDTLGKVVREIQNVTFYYSGGNVEGRLYIMDASNRNYNAVFVFGDLLPLKPAYEAGNLKDFLTIEEIDDTIIWNSNTGVETSNVLSNFSLREYVSEAITLPRGTLWNYMPTVKFSYLLNKALSHYNVPINTDNIQTYMDTLGIKLNGMNNVLGRSDGGVVAMRNFVQDAIGLLPYTPGIPNNLFEVVKRLIPTTTTEYSCIRVLMEYIDPQFEVGSYRSAPRGVLIEVIRDENVVYSWDVSPTSIYNVPVHFKEGDIISAHSYASDLEEAYLQAGYIIASRSFASFDSDNTAYPTNYVLYPNIPDITLSQMLQTIQAVTGYGIGWDNGIIFYDMTFNTEPINIDDRVISFDKITRNIGSNAQANIIDFDSDEDIAEVNRVILDYHIDNETLEAEQTLFTIPLSEGSDNYTDTRDLYIRDIIQNSGVVEFGQSKDTLFIIEDGVSKQISDIPYAPLARIYELSTTITVKTFMYLFEFMGIKYDTTFKCRGNTYAVYNAKWSKNVCTMDLVLVNQPRRIE